MADNLFPGIFLGFCCYVIYFAYYLFEVGPFVLLLYPRTTRCTFTPQCLLASCYLHWFQLFFELFSKRTCQEQSFEVSTPKYVYWSTIGNSRSSLFQTKYTGSILSSLPTTIAHSFTLAVTLYQGSPRYRFFFTVPDRTVLRNDGTFQTVDDTSISHGTTFGGTRYRRIWRYFFGGIEKWRYFLDGRRFFDIWRYFLAVLQNDGTGPGTAKFDGTFLRVLKYDGSATEKYRNTNDEILDSTCRAAIKHAGTTPLMFLHTYIERANRGQTNRRTVKLTNSPASRETAFRHLAPK